MAVFLPTVVLSIVNGFHTSIRDKILASEFELRIYHRYDALDKNLLKILKEHPAVDLAVPFFEKQALVKSPYAQQFISVQIKAFYNADLKKMSLFQKEVQILQKEELFSDKPFASKLISDPLFQIQSHQSIWIGDALAYRLEAYSSDTIQILIPQGEITDLDPKNIRSLQVQDLYSANYAKFNKGIVFIRMDALSKVFALEERPLPYWNLPKTRTASPRTPTYFSSIPRLTNRIHSGTRNFSGFCKRKGFDVFNVSLFAF